MCIRDRIYPDSLINPCVVFAGSLCIIPYLYDYTIFPMRLKADLLLFMVAIIWGTAFVAQGVAGRYGIAFLYNGVSFVLASVILIPFIPRGTKVAKEQW